MAVMRLAFHRFPEGPRHLVAIIADSDSLWTRGTISHLASLSFALFPSARSFG